MTDYGRIRSTVRPEPLELDEYSAYVNTDIAEVTVEIDGETHTEYEFNQVRYTKDELITQQAQQITDTQLALCEIYEGMV